MVLLWRLTRRFLKNPANLFGASVLLLVLLMAAVAPLIARFGENEPSLSATLQPPSSLYRMGTDELGRDIFLRVVWGSRITLTMALTVSVIVAPIGLIIGCVAGYAGCWIDLVLSRIIDTFLAFPSLVLALVFVAALGPNLQIAVIAVALTIWPPIARLARAQAMAFSATDAVAAVRSQGLRIVFVHVMPMCLPSVVVRISLKMAGIILTAAGLGFLGLEAQPPMPEGGVMLSAGRQYMMTSWWLAAMPGLAIMTVSLAFNLVGDGLRDALDPRND